MRALVVVAWLVVGSLGMVAPVSSIAAAQQAATGRARFRGEAFMK